MIENSIMIRDKKIFYRELPGEKGTILFLHGRKHTSADWQETRVTRRLEKYGYRIVALDLPGFGHSERMPGVSFSLLLEELQQSLQLFPLWLVGPASGGRVAIEAALSSRIKLTGLILLAPVETPLYHNDLRLLDLPVLVVWGEEDTIAPLEEAYMLGDILPRREIHLLRGGGHTCYFDEPELFAEIVLEFILKQERKQTAAGCIAAKY